jgi:hypothetical protein
MALLMPSAEPSRYPIARSNLIIGCLTGDDLFVEVGVEVEQWEGEDLKIPRVSFLDVEDDDELLLGRDINKGEDEERVTNGDGDVELKELDDLI